MTITEQLEKELERIEFENFKNELKQYLFLKVNLGVDINIENKIKSHLHNCVFSVLGYEKY